MSENKGLTIGEVVRRGAARLAAAAIDTPLLDARLLAEWAFALNAAGLVLHGREIADGQGLQRFAAALERRLAGEPVHRILGRRAFYAHEFELSPETLEPRPDTETLVTLAAEAARARFESDQHFVMADVGTGTGAIAVSLLALFPAAVAIATDLSVPALETAMRNAVSAGVGDRFWPLACDTLEAIGGRLDLIVSNPPYIPTAVIDSLSREVRDFDPHMALDGGADGLDVYRTLAPQYARLLAPGGDALVEIGAGQEADVGALFATWGFGFMEARRDLSGIVRALRFRVAAPRGVVG